MRFSYKYQYFHICHTNLTGFGWYLLAKYLAALKLLPTASFKHSDCDRDALEKKMLHHRHIVVSGWHVRFYDLFLKYRDEICDLFEIDKQYTEPVKKKMMEADGNDNILRLGVHIRRGDYAKWEYGKYYYSDEVYANHINRFATLHKDDNIHVYAPEDLFMLSECNYLIGPPSTFSLVAAMYKDIPLYRMDTSDAELMTPDTFKLFDYWFRRIV